MTIVSERLYAWKLELERFFVFLDFYLLFFVHSIEHIDSLVKFFIDNIFIILIALQSVLQLGDT